MDTIRRMFRRTMRSRVAVATVAGIALTTVVALPAASAMSGPRDGTGPNGPTAPISSNPAPAAAAGTYVGSGIAGWVVVNADGTLARGHNIVSTAHVATGQYEVIFTVNVRSCAYLATTGLSGSSGTPPSGEVTVVGRATSVNGVFATTATSGGTVSDRGFHLEVIC